MSFKSSFGKPPELKARGSLKLEKLNLSAAEIRKKQMCGSAMQAAMRSPKNKPSKNYLRQNSLQVKEQTNAVREQRVQQQTNISKDLFKLQRFKDVRSQIDVSTPSGWKPRGEGAQLSDSKGAVTSKNFIKENSLKAKRPTSSAQSVAADTLSSQFAPTRPLGIIPAYLQERKEMLRAQEEEKAAVVPDGCKLMREAEHKQILEGLQRRKAEVERDYKRLPLKVETLGQKQRQAKLEAELQEVTKAIATFSTPTVLIETGAN